MSKPLIYTGIGSRHSVPQKILNVAEQIGMLMAIKGWTLYSGAADGMDAAFETGYRVAKELQNAKGDAVIYLPWKKFNNHLQRLRRNSNSRRKTLPDSRGYSSSLVLLQRRMGARVFFSTQTVQKELRGRSILPEL